MLHSQLKRPTISTLSSGFLPTVISQVYPISQLMISGFPDIAVTLALSGRTPISESPISGTPISHHPQANSDITVPELRY